MLRYVLRRLATGLLTILLSFALTFFLIRFAPGNPVKVLAGKDNPNPEQIEHLTKVYGLDQSVGTQFIKYINNALHGYFGYSYKSHLPVTTILGRKIVPTVILTLTASLLSVIIGTALGVFAGRRSGHLSDRLLCDISYVIDAVPSFWLAMILIMLFAGKLKWLPTSGMYDIRGDYEGFKKFLDLLRHMILPIATLVIIQVPVYFRIARSSVLHVLGSEFIRTYRATGMSERRIFGKYVLRNALIPIITTFSMSLAFLISGVALIEIVFAWPGMGRVILDAINGRDYPVLTGVYLLISISISVFMMLTDILYAWVDPRIRLE